MNQERENPAEPSEAQQEMIRGEMERLAYDHILVENECYLAVRAWASQIPGALYEVGRLRELAFRKAGKGSGRRLDLDQFDLYYMHVLIWSKEESKIIGACRIGQVDIVLKRYGQEGLYTGRLSTYLSTFVRHKLHTLEISKAFIRDEYQKQVVPISLLCRGIGKFMLNNPHYRGLIGFVTNKERIQNDSKSSRTNRASTKVTGLPIPSGGKGISNVLRMGGTIGEDSVLAFIDLAESRTALRYCMGKAGSERFIEYHHPRHERAA